MVVKRPFGEQEEEEEQHYFPPAIQQSKHRRIVASNFADQQNVMCLFSSQELVLTLEPLIRRCIREEVQRTCQSFFLTLPKLNLGTSPTNSPNASQTTSSLQLRFEGNLATTFFTGSRIESGDKSAVRLVLFDVNSNKVVSSGPYSSLKVEIVALDGDFAAEDEEDWAEKDFDGKVITARDGRRPLITGDLVVSLENGVGELGEVCFTDNSSWRRSRKFMIGARVKKDTCCGGLRIREAKTQAFVVKDHRGESYKKHHPPALGDEVWRLEKIAKDGVFHKRLTSNRICTVKDLLQMYIINQSALRKLLGGSSNKTWEVIIKHAKECVLDDKLYIHRYGADGTGLVFNSVMAVVGATFDGQSYLPLDKLLSFQMPVVEAIKQQVYKELDGIVPIDASSIFEVSAPMFNLHTMAEPELFKTMDHQDGMKCFSTDLRNSFILKELCNGAYDEDLAAANFDDFQTGPSLWQGDELFIDPSNQTIDIFSSEFGICFSSNGSPRGRWCKIRAALKWGSVRRDVAAKRMAESPSYLDFLV